MRMITPIHVGHRETIVKEPDIELAFLQHPSNMLVVLRRIRIGPGIWVAPRRR
jgi:hypothetical protein